jgi:hypothetical protein
MGLDLAGLGEHSEEAVQDREPLGGGGRGLARDVSNHPVPDARLVAYQAMATRRIIGAESRQELLDDVTILGTALPGFFRGGALVLGPDSFGIGPIAAGARLTRGHRRSSPAPTATSRACVRPLMFVVDATKWPRHLAVSVSWGYNRFVGQGVSEIS